MSADWCHSYPEAFPLALDLGNFCGHLPLLPVCPPPAPLPSPTTTTHTNVLTLQRSQGKASVAHELLGWPGLAPAACTQASCLHCPPPPQPSAGWPRCEHQFPVTRLLPAPMDTFHSLSSVTSLMHDTPISFLKCSVPLDFMMFFSPRVFLL